MATNEPMMTNEPMPTNERTHSAHGPHNEGRKLVFERKTYTVKRWCAEREAYLLCDGSWAYTTCVDARCQWVDAPSYEAKTETGRTSSSEPNLSNVPRQPEAVCPSCGETEANCKYAYLQCGELIASGYLEATRQDPEETPEGQGGWLRDTIETMRTLEVQAAEQARKPVLGPYLLDEDLLCEDARKQR